MGFAPAPLAIVLHYPTPNKEMKQAWVDDGMEERRVLEEVPANRECRPPVPPSFAAAPALATYASTHSWNSKGSNLTWCSIERECWRWQNEDEVSTKAQVPPAQLHNKSKRILGWVKPDVSGWETTTRGSASEDHFSLTLPPLYVSSPSDNYILFWYLRPKDTSLVTGSAI